MWSGINIPHEGRGRKFALRQLRSLAAHGGFNVGGDPDSDD
jgi:WhiB family redox-sensing transcriptional regulator